MEFPIRFTFSSEVTHEELANSFIDTSTTSIDQLAEVWTERAFDGTPEEANKQFGFDEWTNGLEYLSFLSRPFEKLDAGERIFEQVFPADANYLQTGLQNYVAFLSHAINSAPGNDSNWPYGRHLLWDLDGNIGAKLINMTLWFNADENRGIKWGLTELHQLYCNLRTFGLNLCNFKDSLSDDMGPWRGFIEKLTFLEKSEHPLIDKVVIRQIVTEVVNKYIELRKDSSLRDELMEDLTFFKQCFTSYEEIQIIKIDGIRDPSAREGKSTTQLDKKLRYNLQRLSLADALILSSQCPRIRFCTSPDCCLDLGRLSGIFGLQIYCDSNFSDDQDNERCLKHLSPELVSEASIQALATLSFQHECYRYADEWTAHDLLIEILPGVPLQILERFNERAQAFDPLLNSVTEFGQLALKNRVTALKRQIAFGLVSMAFPDSYLDNFIDADNETQ